MHGPERVRRIDEDARSRPTERAGSDTVATTSSACFGVARSDQAPKEMFGSSGASGRSAMYSGSVVQEHTCLSPCRALAASSVFGPRCTLAAVYKELVGGAFEGVKHRRCTGPRQRALTFLPPFPLPSSSSPTSTLINHKSSALPTTSPHRQITFFYRVISRRGGSPCRPPRQRLLDRRSHLRGTECVFSGSKVCGG